MTDDLLCSPWHVGQSVNISQCWPWQEGTLRTAAGALAAGALAAGTLAAGALAAGALAAGALAAGALAHQVSSANI